MRAGTRTWTPTDGANAGHEQRRLEVVADEVAPSLRWATATLAKTARTDAPDPTATPDASARVGDDVPLY